MQNRLKKYIALAILSTGLGISSMAAAENVNLAVLETELNGQQAKIELWGEQLKSGYADNLLILVKNNKQQVATAFKPSVTGGYNFLLEEVKLTKDGRQILLSAAQGDWQADTEFRIIDFSNLKNVQEIFSAADNYGIIKTAVIEEGRLNIVLADDNTNSAQIDDKLLNSINQRQLQAKYGRLYSLSCRDLNNDGIDEVLTTQRIMADKKPLADIGAVWSLDKDNNWQKKNFTILVAGFTEPGNTINDGKYNAEYAVLPRKIVLPNGECTYPVVSYTSNLKLQKKVNLLLEQELRPYTEGFIAGENDVAFNVLRADKDLLSLQIISGKGKFFHHHIHIDPQTGEKVKLADIFNVEDKDFLPLLNLLNTNKQIEFTEGLPAEWYLTDGRLYLVVNICGQEEAAVYVMGNLHKYVKDKKWLQN